jgi:lipopolysaccharide/colanic/teichoic acid biosynthesis glycosyltransferase
MERRVRPAGGIWKRPFDFSAALAGLVIMSPMMLMITLLIMATMGRQIISGQPSIRSNGSVFIRLKFRTVVADHADAAAPRVTWLGTILRESRLDELPQLLNILRGDMSFVGPQGLLSSELVRYYADGKPHAQASPFDGR